MIRRRLAPEALLLAGLAVLMLLVYVVTRDGTIASLTGNALSALYILLQLPSGTRRRPKSRPGGKP